MHRKDNNKYPNKQKKNFSTTMKEVLKLVSVADYPEFKQRVLEVTQWKKSQYNDRKVGRIKISHVEREVLRGIAEQIKKEGGA